jgi:hypothetical protein
MEREQLVIELDRNRVTLTLNLASHHAAIETYEKLLAQAREGFVRLDISPQSH